MPTTIELHRPAPANAFDARLASSVLEHVWKPAEGLSHCHTLLKAGVSGLPPNCWLLLAPAFLLQLIPFLAIARHRLIDGDEGFYLMASRLVFEHKVPYRDFFFTQMPLSPYVYGLWMQVAGHSWASARTLSALLAALAGTVLFAHVCAETKRRAAGLLAIALFTSSTLVFAWFTVAKTYALSGVFLLLAYFIFMRRPPADLHRTVAITGLVLGFAVDVRLYLLGLAPVFLWWICQDAEARARLRAVLWFLTGFAVAVLPNVYFLALDPQAYMFDNLLFHAIRSDAGLVGNIRQKLVVFGDAGGNALQTSLFLAVIVMLAGHAKAWLRPVRRALQLAAALALISLVPTPTYTQYFCLCIPFLIVAAVCSASGLLDSLKPLRRRRLAAAGAVALVALFAAASGKDCMRFLETGQGVDGILDRDRASDWRIDTVKAVSRGIDELADPGERVMSFWPGYYLESGAEPPPGFENNTGRERAYVLRPGELSHYHIVSGRQIARTLASHNPRLVVLGNQESMAIEAEPYAEMLVRSGYVAVRRIDHASIWSAP